MSCKSNHCSALEKLKKFGKHTTNIEVIRLNFQQNVTNSHLYYFVHQNHVIIYFIVVDDIAFGSKSPDIMKQFNSNISATFDVKLYVELKSFILWNIKKAPTKLYVTQTSYAERLLHRFCIINRNLVITTLPSNVDVSPPHMH